MNPQILFRCPQYARWKREYSVVFCILLTSLQSACVNSGAIRDLKPTVILISLDGFRGDYLEKYQPPHLESLAREGVQARWMIPSFPSKTFPNHYAIVTGLYPQNNGIVENNIYDKGFNALFTMSKREEVQNGRWWLGEPIWITAEKQGQKTAPYFWPGSEAEIAGRRPTYWEPYDGKVPNEARVDMILSRLDLTAAERPAFLSLYFSDVDNAGHDFGPDSEETRNAVHKVDTDLGRLIDGLKTRGVYEKINLIVVSDHGMAAQDPNNVIILDDFFDARLAERIIWTGEIVSIFPAPGKDDAIYESLKTRLPAHAIVYRKAELPERFHYSNSPRIAPLLVLPDEGWTLASRAKFEEDKTKQRKSPMKGGHGYDNQLPSMRAIFIAHGAAFKKGAVLEPFENVEVYNVMTGILGLAAAPNDGHAETAKEALGITEQREP